MQNLLDKIYAFSFKPQLWVIISYFIFSSFGLANLLEIDSQKAVKGEGFHYHSVIKEYIDGGYNFKAIKFSTNQDDIVFKNKESYAQQMMYPLVVGAIYKLTKVDLQGNKKLL